MPFRMRRDAFKWFEDVRGDMQRDFDVYYLCLLAGFASNKKTDVESEDDAYNLIEVFPDVYRDKRHLLVSLFLSREIRARGVQNIRSQMNELIAQLVDPASATGLSTEGLRLFNKYSFGGFDSIVEWFDDKPRSLEAFLSKYRKKIEESSAAS